MHSAGALSSTEVDYAEENYGRPGRLHLLRPLFCADLHAFMVLLRAAFRPSLVNADASPQAWNDC